MLHANSEVAESLFEPAIAAKPPTAPAHQRHDAVEAGIGVGVQVSMASAAGRYDRQIFHRRLDPLFRTVTRRRIAGTTSTTKTDAGRNEPVPPKGERWHHLYDDGIDGAFDRHPYYGREEKIIINSLGFCAATTEGLMTSTFPRGEPWTKNFSALSYIDLRDRPAFKMARDFSYHGDKACCSNSYP